MSTHIKNNPIRSILTLFLLVLCLPLSACAATLAGEAIEGQVLEEGANRPIPGTIVVGLWHGSVTHGFVEGRTVCYHVETATTDPQGRYTLPATEKERKYVDGYHYTAIYVYKPGYHATDYVKGRFYRREDKKYVVTLLDQPSQLKIVDTLKEAQAAVRINDRYLKPFTGTRSERLEYLMRFSGLVGCYSAGDEKPLVSVYKSLYDEAKRVASSDNDKNMLHTIRRQALYAWSRPSREMTSREIEQAINNDPYLREQFQ